MAEIRSLLIGLLLFSGIVIGMSAFYGELTRPSNLVAYGLTPAEIAAISPENLSSRSVVDDITEQTKSIEEALRSRPTGITTVDVAWGYINAGLSAVTLPLTAIALFQNMITDSFDVIGVPPFLAGIVITIILIIIVFSVLSAYLKWRI